MHDQQNIKFSFVVGFQRRRKQLPFAQGKICNIELEPLSSKRVLTGFEYKAFCRYFLLLPKFLL